MPNTTKRRWCPQLVPPVLMLGAVAGYAAIILLASLSHAESNPLRFRALMSVAAAPCYLYACRQRSMTKPAFWRRLARRLGEPTIGLMTAATLASTLDYGILAYASRQLPISAVATIYDAWPTAVILLLCLAAWRIPPPATLWAMPVALAGISLTGVATAPVTVGWEPQRIGSLTAGFAAAIGAPLISAFAVLAFPAGQRLADLWPEDNGPNAASKATMMLYAICDLAAAPLLYTAGMDTPIGWPYALLAGVSLATAAWCWRQANARARHPGINAVAYLSPLATLGLLAATGRAGSVRWVPVTAGAALIVAANCASLLPRRKRTTSD